MFATTIYLDRIIPPDQLAVIFAAAAGVEPNRVARITRGDFEQSPRHWFRDDHALGLQTWDEGGDFPFAVEFISRSTPNLRAVLDRAAHDLDVAILTDGLDADLFDTGWRVIMPDGSSAIVHADPDQLDGDDPAIVLEPDSRARYQALRAKREVETVAP